MRTEPPSSLPIEAKQSPSASAAALPVEECRGAGGEDSGGIDVVLERDGNAMQEPARARLAIERAGLFESAVVEDGDEGVEAALALLNAGEHEPGELFARNLPAADLGGRFGG